MRHRAKDGRRYTKSKYMFFSIFLALMVCSKGFGLDNGDKLYYIISVISIPFWFFHVVTLRWTSSTLSYAMVIFTVAFFATLTTGKTGILLSVMLMIAVKDSDREKLIELILKLWAVCISIMIILVSLGIVTDKVVSENGKTWHGMGYRTGNLFNATVVILFILYLYYRKTKLTFWEITFVLFSNFVVYKFSASRTGLIMGVFAVLLACLLKLAQENRRILKMIMAGLCAGIFIVVLSSFIIPVLYDGDWGSNRFPNVVNRAMTGRIQHAKTVMTSDPVTLFGNTGELTAFIDNAYVFLVMKYGIAVSVMICVVYFLAVKSMVNREDIYAVYVVSLFVVFGFTEQFFINSFMNYSFLFVGNEIINVLLRRHEKVGRLQRRNQDV